MSGEPKVKPRSISVAAGERVDPVALLGEQLRAMFDHVAQEPPPEHILALVDQLDALQPEPPGEGRSFEDE